MPSREVPLRTKLLYGAGDAAINIKNSVINLFLLFFYADVLGASPQWIGAAIFIGKVWDAVTDPAMGYISDTTGSRWGRRRPYVVLSALPMGVAFYLLFSPPPLSPAATVAYLCVTAIALYTCFTVYATPYLAWGAELARDYHERTEVVQVRAIFGGLGGMLGATLPAAITREAVDPRVAYSRMGLLLGALIVVSGLVVGFFVKDRPVSRSRATGFRHFLGGLRQTFANRQFAVIFATFCLMTASASLSHAVQLIVIKYRLLLYDRFALIALVFALSFAASFPLWQTLSRRLGKQRALVVALQLGCIAPFGWILVPPGNLTAMLVFMVVGGLLTGSITLAASAAADAIDLDELATGEQRAGAYFGIWTLGLKIASAVGVLLAGLLLSLVGYLPEQTQAASTMWWLVMAVGPLQALANLVGYLIFRDLRIEASDIRRVQAELDARRSFVDPTG